MNSRWLQPEFADSFPVASVMKHRLPKMWMRIHVLPESKRYPENDDERSIISDRYARFGNALIGEGEPCTLVRSRMNVAEPEAKYQAGLTWSSLHEIREDEEDTWYSWAAETTWRSGAFRDLLLDVAEDRDWGVLFISEASGNIFAPYDGGADGFSFDSDLLARLKTEFQPWLSSREDGL